MDLFALLAIILGLSALFSYINERLLHLETTIGLMLLALGFSLLAAILDVFGAIELIDAQRRFVAQLDLGDTLLKGVLCFMLFAGSVNVKLKLLAEEKWLIGSLAIGGTLVAWLLIGGMLWGVALLFGLAVSPIYFFLFGALIAPTDPIAALAILGRAGLPDRLEAIISGESLFNDGVGVVLFTMCLAIAIAPVQPTFGDAVVLFLREVLGGIALGVCAAVLMYWMLHRSEDYGTQLLASLGIVALSYSLAEHIEVSGPIASVVTGLLIGNFARPQMADTVRARFDTFWHGIDEILNALLFVLIGLNIVLLHPVEDFPAAITAIIVCLIARAISVHIPIALLRRTSALTTEGFGLTRLLTWGGLRGGLALALALSIPAAPEKAGVLYMTYAVVAFSIIVQGLTISRFFKPDALARLIK
jgi:CPA1 family monovalent cation:H+ antiporter